jgi:hypothetical protein
MPIFAQAAYTELFSKALLHSTAASVIFIVGS